MDSKAAWFQLHKQPGKPFTITIQTSGMSLTLYGAGVICCCIAGAIWLGAKIFSLL